MIRKVREMRVEEIDLITNYFHCLTPELLLQQGIDRNKLPGKENWKEIISNDFNQPLEKRKFYYLLWLIDEIPIGHSNLNDIVLGEQAYMHLHIWQTDFRQKGNGSFFVEQSLPFYFKKFNLKKIYCRPNSMNPAPNITLQKVGFQFVKIYETIPGWINFNQFVNLWVFNRDSL